MHCSANTVMRNEVQLLFVFLANRFVVLRFARERKRGEEEEEGEGERGSSIHQAFRRSLLPSFPLITPPQSWSIAHDLPLPTSARDCNVVEL